MRPRSLDEVAGQSELLGEQGFLRRALAQDRVPSLIFWGPPGTGKTTLARLIAQGTAAQFVPFSAVTSGIKEIKEVMAQAQRLRRSQGRRTLLFVDEIHRFNRAQQDAFLPYVEQGDIVLVGATTENPSFELNAALLSRCRVVVLKMLEPEDVIAIVERALRDGERGLAGRGVAVPSDSLAAVARFAGGDARRALNLIEVAVDDAVSRGVEKVSPSDIEHVAQRKVLLYDKRGEEHFNLISALHKSLRESDPDAALYWLVRMLEGGEDGGYIARRLVRFASEDVGVADPRGLDQALAAWQAYERLGDPEGHLALAQAVVYLALAPKSNALYRAHGAVRAAVEELPAEPPPLAIRNAPTSLMRELGYGRDYVYAHDTEDGVGGIDCLPEALAGRRFYTPTERGFEAELGRRLDAVRVLRRKARTEKAAKPGAGAALPEGRPK
jgi:putative ATPase